MLSYWHVLLLNYIGMLARLVRLSSQLVHAGSADYRVGPQRAVDGPPRHRFYPVCPQHRNLHGFLCELLVQIATANLGTVPSCRNRHVYSLILLAVSPLFNFLAARRTNRSRGV